MHDLGDVSSVKCNFSPKYNLQPSAEQVCRQSNSVYERKLTENVTRR